MTWKQWTNRAVFALALVMMGASLVQAAVVLPPIPKKGGVTAEDQAEAETAYNAAYGAYENGDMDGALDYAKAAFNALPNASTAILKAVILGAMEKPRSAFFAYLQARDLKPNAEEREYVTAGLAEQGAKCDPAMGWAVIRTDPPGTTVRVGSKTFKAPRTVGLSEGTFMFSFEADGYRTVEKEIEVSAGEAVPTKKSNINMTPDAKKEVVQETSTPTKKKDDSQDQKTADSGEVAVTASASAGTRGGPDGLTLGLLGGGGAMFIGAGVTGLLGSLANKEAEELFADYQVATGAQKEALRVQGQEKTDEYNQMSTISFALLGISVPVLAYGVYRFVSSSASGDSAGAESTATVTPVLLREGGGAVLLNGSF